MIDVPRLEMWGASPWCYADHNGEHEDQETSSKANGKLHQTLWACTVIACVVNSQHYLSEQGHKHRQKSKYTLIIIISDFCRRVASYPIPIVPRCYTFGIFSDSNLCSLRDRMIGTFPLTAGFVIIW
jgi:hypothetical protein